MLTKLKELKYVKDDEYYQSDVYIDLLNIVFIRDCHPSLTDGLKPHGSVCEVEDRYRNCFLIVSDKETLARQINDVYWEIEYKNELRNQMDGVTVTHRWATGKEEITTLNG